MRKEKQYFMDFIHPHRYTTTVADDGEDLDVEGLGREGLYGGEGIFFSCEGLLLRVGEIECGVGVTFSVIGLNIFHEVIFLFGKDLPLEVPFTRPSFIFLSSFN